MPSLTKLVGMSVAVVTLAFPMWSQQSEYTLTVEANPAIAPDLTTYRFYVDMTHSTDRMSAVFGNNQSSLVMNTPEGVFNTAFNVSWNASGINPAFLTMMPTLADDTYATIGLEGPASTSGVANAADPALVEDPDHPISPYFLDNGATGVDISTLTGASWYILNTATNGLPDADNRVFIMQVTTGGNISGQINYQVFPLGVGENQLQLSAQFDGEGTFNSEVIVLIPGCMDPSACNFDPAVNVNDNTCEFAEEFYNCDDSCTNDVDNDGVCDELEIVGCADPLACNYNPETTDSDGSCAFAEEFYNCNGSCTNDMDNDGVCDELEIQGCTDPFACNFDHEATDEDSSCEHCSCLESAVPYPLWVEASTAASESEMTVYRFYIQLQQASDRVSAVYGNQEDPLVVNAPQGIYNNPINSSWSASGINPVLFAVYPDLEYDSYATIGLDGPANESDIPGATDPSAVGEAGLSPFFTTDGAIELNINDSIGSSWFILSDADNGLPDDDLRVLIMQVSTAGEISGQLNYQVFDGGEGASAVYVSVLFDGAGAFGWNNECACNGIPEGDCDCDGNQLDALGVCGGDCAADIDDDGTCDNVDECVGSIDACGICNGPGDIYECGCSDIPAGVCDCEGNKLDALGICGGDCADDADGDGICDDVDGCVGEFDGCGVCNGPGAIYECGCADIPEGDCDCDGNQLDALDVCGGNCAEDADDDGICDDVDECVGSEPDALGVCGGNCAEDADDDGICDNVDPCIGSATDCCTDSNQNGLCDEDETVGCTFPGAENYNPAATIDNGTCIETCAGDLNGDWQIQLTDLLDFLLLYGTDCEETCAGDLNGDGQIQLTDLLDFLLLYGTDCD